MKERWIALCLLALAACNTHDRVWRVSPLSGEGESSPDRVNLWPLAYHGDEGTSVLWPIFDVDENGFAVRPLVSRDLSKWSVLWPWMKWDTDTGEGWAFPYYDIERNRGVFPIANFGKYSWVTLAWWKKNDAGKVASGGLFPLAYFGDFSYVGPWWSGKKGSSWGLFPLFGKNFAGVNHVGPAWWIKDEDSFGLLPLFHYGNGGKELGVLPFYAHVVDEESQERYYLMGLGRTHQTPTYHRNWLLPFWYDYASEKAEDQVLFPFYYRRERPEGAHVFTLLGDRREAPEGSSLNLYPLWWSSASEEARWKMLLPLFYYKDREGERTLITPLGGRGWSTTGNTRYVNVLGPLYHRSRTEDGSESRTAFLWPLFERHKDGDETSTRALPFFTHHRSPEGSESWYAAGLGHRAKTEDSRSWRLSPLAAVSRSDDEDADVPSPLYYLALYGHHVQGEESDRYLFPLYRQKSDAHSSEATFVLGLGRFARHGESRAWHVWPLAASSDGYETQNIAHETTLFGRARWDSGWSFHIGGPFLYDHAEDDRGDIRWKHTRLLTFFTRDVSDFDRGRVPAAVAPALGDTVGSDRRGFLLGLFHDQSARHRRWKQGVLDEEEAKELHEWSSDYDKYELVVDARDSEAARDILARRGVAPGEDGDEALSAAIRGFAEENTELVTSRDGGIPLLYGYENSPVKSEWYGPLWLVHRKKDRESSSTSFLYYGYRSKTKGGKTSRDVFPFITWDTTESGEKKTISFLWRLFRYEREGDRRGGYLFFIPWGDV